MADADIIGAFISRTTCKTLVHKLGRKGPRTTKELLDIATITLPTRMPWGAIFDLTKGGKAKCDEAPDEGTSGRPGKKEEQEEGRGRVHCHRRAQGRQGASQ